MEILTNVKDILQMARDERCSGYTAELLVKDLNELIALREAGEKMAERLRDNRSASAMANSTIQKILLFSQKDSDALAEWEAANK